ncbi:single-stranded-DNA-specific exonuclease RecJ [Candidatus Peregrinibacteria bacterium]|nr:single-stranded-DNA-specific exonuclease RecJ [Candidatus Peregrinibacteria bacterium]
MSVLNKHWHIQNNDKNASLFTKLLSNRGLKTDSEIQNFLYPDPARDFHNPFLMNDMAHAVARIGSAIEKSERIMIFGDYDVDGITASAILMRCLTKLGSNVSYRLPHRIEDGYGMREKFVREAKKLDVKLIITVDNGISGAGEIAAANELGIDTIVTDHHAIPEILPPAFAILHPKLPNSKYPFKDLTGAGVAFKLAEALFKTRLNDPEKAQQETEKLLDLACMGTIADVGELKGENRAIVKEGLKTLENTRWPGLSMLKKSAGVSGKIDTHIVNFLLGPRLNAAGRMSHPSHALRLLLHDKEHSELLAETLEKLNRKRQKLTEDLMEIADALAQSQKHDPAIIISHKDFHGGIIGLLASKLTEKYSRPAIVMEQRKEIFVGSCRSIPDINIFDVLSSAKDLFTHFGGHAAAAGFDLPKVKLDEFTRRIKAHVSSTLPATSYKLQATLNVDCELSHADVSQKTIELIKLFEPFGNGNPPPLFLCKNVFIRRHEKIGSDKKHLKILGEIKNGETIDCIGFKLGQFADKLNDANALDIVCELEENVWRGNKKLQLKIVDFACPQN